MNEQRIRQIIREELSELIKSDRYTFTKDIQMMPGRSILFGSDGGTFGSIGLSDTKLGFFGQTPIVQQSSTGELTGVNNGSGAFPLYHNATFTGNSGSTAYTLSDVVKHLKAYGLLDS